MAIKLQIYTYFTVKILLSQNNFDAGEMSFHATGVQGVANLPGMMYHPY